MADSREDSSERLEFLSESYQTLANDLPISLLVKNTTGKILFANTAYLAFSGRDLSNIVGKSDYDFVTPRLGEKYRQADEHVVKSGETLTDYGKHESIDGQTLLIEYRKVPVFDKQGTVVAIQFMCWDVTRRRNAEQALAHERFLFNSLLEYSPDLIYFKDQESRFTRVSKSIQQALGIPQQEMLGKTDGDFFAPEQAEKMRDDELQIMQSCEPIVGQVEYQSREDERGQWYSTTKIPLRDDEANIVGTFGISRNVTELKESREKLKHALLVASGASRAKSEFVANMSHEIRTPMNGIIGIAELLSDTMLDADQKEYVDMIRQSSESLMGLLNDILDFSKIEAGKLELDAIPFNLSDSVGKTSQSLASRAAEKGLELACRVSPTLPERLIGDPSRLRQVIVNLVGNAIKFTDRGEIVVEVEQQTASDQVAVLHFSVRDTGIGIPEEKRQLIFEEFSQADASTTRRFGGTGLGLTISRQLVCMMGGDIWIESEVNVGTTFHFTAEFGIADEQPASSRFQLASLEGVSALVVDDNSTNRLIIEEMLKGWQLAPTAVEGGVQAITAMQKAAKAGTPFRLVLLDCMMPGMDGFSVAELISGNPVFKNPTIIMISSAAGLGDATRCRKAGIIHHMTKPVIKSELFDVIVDALGQHQAKDEKRTASLLTAAAPLNVLLVEDDLINQRVAVGFLKQAGHHVTVASTGREAVNMISSFADSSMPDFDVILMDIQMPEMDGLEATALVREQEKKTGQHVPIVAMTAAAMKGDRERCLAAGMDGYLSKPITASTLYDAMNFQNEGDQTAVQQDSQVAAGDLADGCETEMIVEIDFDEAKGNLPAGDKVLSKLLSIFLVECPRLVNSVQTKLAAGDSAAVKTAAHTLQGSSKILRADELASISRHIETLATHGNLAEIETFIPRLLSVANQTCALMQARCESKQE